MSNANTQILKDDGQSAIIKVTANYTTTANTIVIPKNLKIIVEDANTYKTATHYDCLFLDHYKDGGKEGKDVARTLRIPHSCGDPGDRREV